MWLTAAPAAPLAVCLAAAAAALLVPLPVRRPGRAGRPPGPRLVLLAATVAVCLAATVAPGLGVPAGILAAVAVGGGRLVRRRRLAREVRDRADRVLESCELLASELSAGQPPGAALSRAASGWPPLQPAAEEFSLGGSVPARLRRLAEQPGADDLRLVAAAWELSHRTGDGLADALHRCAAALRESGATRRLVEGELASARATARMVAALPVLTLVLGSGAGGDPVSFLVGHPLGWACLAGGLLFGFLGLWWIESLAGDVQAR